MAYDNTDLISPSDAAASIGRNARAEAAKPAVQIQSDELEKNRTEERITDADRQAIVDLVSGRHPKTDQEKDEEALGLPFYMRDLGEHLFGKATKERIESFARGHFHIASEEIKVAASRPEVLQAIKEACDINKVDLAIALKIAYVESRLNPNALNGSSSAAGLFQLLKGTRQGMLDKNPWLIPLVGSNRLDPRGNALIGTLLEKQTADHLRAALHHDPNAGEIYLGHFLGETGAIRVLKQGDNAPLGLSSEVIRENQKALGGMQTVGDLVAWANRKMNSVDVTPLINAANGQQVAVAPTVANRGNHGGLTPTAVAAASPQPRRSRKPNHEHGLASNSPPVDPNA